MKFGELLREIDREIQERKAEDEAGLDPEYAAFDPLRFGMVPNILSCYLRDDAQSGMVTASYNLVKLAQTLAPELTGRSALARSKFIIEEALKAGIFDDADEEYDGAEVLLGRAEKELGEKGFVDFARAGQGHNSLVLKGTRSDGTIAAIRLISGHYRHPPSIAILPIDDYLQLPRNQQIEITEFAKEIGPATPPEEMEPEQFNLWSQRVVYLQAMLHSERKFVWEDAAFSNLGMFQGGAFISDPGLGDFEDDIYDYKHNVTLVAERIDDQKVEFSPDENGIFVSEFFTGIAAAKPAQITRVRAFARQNEWHAMTIPTQTMGKVVILVDPSRQNDGLELNKAMRDYLATKGPGLSRKVDLHLT